MICKFLFKFRSFCTLQISAPSKASHICTLKVDIEGFIIVQPYSISTNFTKQQGLQRAQVVVYCKVRIFPYISVYTLFTSFENCVHRKIFFFGKLIATDNAYDKEYFGEPVDRSLVSTYTVFITS